MKKYAILLLILTGCATPTDLRNGAPDVDQASTKSADQVAGCVGDAFERANPNVPFAPGTTFSTRPTSTGYSIAGTQAGSALMGGTDTILLVDIVTTDSGSHVTLYDHLLAGSSKWAGLVRGCL